MIKFKEHALIETDDLWYDLIDNYTKAKSRIDLTKVLEEPSLSEVRNAIQVLKDFAYMGELEDIIHYY